MEDSTPKPCIRQYFVRRKKNSSSSRDDLTEVGGLAKRVSSTSRRSSGVSTPRSSWKVSEDAFHWVGRSLALRRSSMIVGMMVPVVQQLDVTAERKKAAPRKKKRRIMYFDPGKEEEYKREEELLKRKFAEIDGFELVVEEPSPERKNSKQDKCKGTLGVNLQKCNKDGDQSIDPSSDASVQGRKHKSMGGGYCASHRFECMSSTVESFEDRQVISTGHAQTPGKCEWDRFCQSGDTPASEGCMPERIPKAPHLEATTPDAPVEADEKRDVSSRQQKDDLDAHDTEWLEAMTPEGCVLETGRKSKCTVDKSHDGRQDTSHKMIDEMPSGRREATKTPMKNLNDLTNVVDLTKSGTTGVQTAGNVGRGTGRKSDAGTVDLTTPNNKAQSAGIGSMSFSSSAYTPLQRLLEVCKQEMALEKIPSMHDALSGCINLKDVRKVGEGSYGEAFVSNDTIVKIVPIEGEESMSGPQQTSADEIMGEVIISKMLSDLRLCTNKQNSTHGFAHTCAVQVCKGKYCPKLVAEWNRWNRASASENESVAYFDDNQLYVVFTLEFAGEDLERFDLRGFDEARSILAQVVLTLSVGEEALQFEHRDLHLGNILVSRSDVDPAWFKLQGQRISVRTSGVAAVLIDFTLSRLSPQNGQVVFYDLAQDQDIFAGPRWNQQAETYRKMKGIVGNHWERYKPKTNALWVQFVVDSLLSRKSLKMTSNQRRMLRGFRQRAGLGEGCRNLVFDEFFTGILLVEANEDEPMSV